MNKIPQEFKEAFYLMRCMQFIDKNITLSLWSLSDLNLQVRVLKYGLVSSRAAYQYAIYMENWYFRFDRYTISEVSVSIKIS